ncbi:MAG: hypothetical protein U5P10_16790 [Spirochaetia bacterium]|nr:hypothetical protein [Spirochaetia bacterium]
MTDKDKKGLFTRLFSERPKKGGCCNIQFEEISDENYISENQKNKNSAKIEDKADITNKKKEQ